MQALSHLQANAERLYLDSTRIVLAAVSAGAQISAQVAALVMSPGYADVVGLARTITPAQLRGVVLACGPFDLALLWDGSTTATGRRLVKSVLWAYSGKRRFRDDAALATLSVADHVTTAFPPALLTVGNADPLRGHSELLVSRLRANGHEPETVFFPADHEPPLSHEYQFNLDTPAGQRFLKRMLSFLEERLGERA
jgi:acetyl esterase/lipase